MFRGGASENYSIQKYTWMSGEREKSTFAFKSGGLKQEKKLVEIFFMKLHAAQPP